MAQQQQQQNQFSQLYGQQYGQQQQQSQPGVDAFIDERQPGRFFYNGEWYQNMDPNGDRFVFVQESSGERVTGGGLHSALTQSWNNAYNGGQVNNDNYTGPPPTNYDPNAQGPVGNVGNGADTGTPAGTGDDTIGIGDLVVGGVSVDDFNNALGGAYNDAVANQPVIQGGANTNLIQSGTQGSLAVSETDSSADMTATDNTNITGTNDTTVNNTGLTTDLLKTSQEDTAHRKALETANASNITSNEQEVESTQQDTGSQTIDSQNRTTDLSKQSQLNQQSQQDFSTGFDDLVETNFNNQSSTDTSFRDTGQMSVGGQTQGQQTQVQDDLGFGELLRDATGNQANRESAANNTLASIATNGVDDGFQGRMDRAIAESLSGPQVQRAGASAQDRVASRAAAEVGQNAIQNQLQASEMLKQTSGVGDLAAVGRQFAGENTSSAATNYDRSTGFDDLVQTNETSQEGGNTSARDFESYNENFGEQFTKGQNYNVGTQEGTQDVDMTNRSDVIQNTTDLGQSNQQSSNFTDDFNKVHSKGQNYNEQNVNQTQVTDQDTTQNTDGLKTQNTQANETNAGITLGQMVGSSFGTQPEGGGGGSIICAVLCSLGMLPRRQILDAAMFSHSNLRALRYVTLGYLSYAPTVARLILKFPILGYLFLPVIKLINGYIMQKRAAWRPSLLQTVAFWSFCASHDVLGMILSLFGKRYNFNDKKLLKIISEYYEPIDLDAYYTQHRSEAPRFVW
jgi:hypothetical protein